MKKKTVWRFALALALMVSAIGASTAAFAAAPDTAEPTTAIATENEDAIWKQIEVVEEKRDAIFQRNTALWEKLDEIYNALPEDYDFTNFDEAAFIRSTNALTEAEKNTLLADIKELNGLEAEMEALYEKLPDCDNMLLYEEALENADETGAPFHAAVKSVPAPKGSPAYVADLPLRKVYNGGVAGACAVYKLYAA